MLNNKIIVILGPTSSGKSEVAIKLAKEFNGEIISADSRQIYRGMDIGTGKVEPDRPGEIPRKFINNKFCSGSRRNKIFSSEGIPHHMIDIINPKINFTAAQFKKKAEKIITDILKRDKLPIVCGGTGFWIKSLVDNVVYPEVAPNKLLRSKLRNKSTKELFKTLKKLDQVRAENIDSKNPVRLIRAIEICKAIGKVPTLECHPELVSGSKNKTEMLKQVQHDNIYDFFQIGISVPKEELHKKIKARLKKRFTAGMIAEVKKLHTKDKISWKKIESFGLGYKLIPQYLRGEIENKEELLEKVYLAEKNYAKRQMTWFRKDKRIEWLEDYKKIEEEVKKFIN